MNKKSETIVFFGNERLATGVQTSAPTLQALVRAGYNVKAVISNYEAGMSRQKRELEIAAVAKSHNIPLLLPEKLTGIRARLAGFEAVAAVLVAYGKIVPQSIIDVFPRGIINIHPSLLPLHRGPIPIEAAILENAPKTGVSLMNLTKVMDAGPVYAQSKIDLKGTESKQELADMLLEIGSTMLLDLLPGIIDGSIIALPQDESNATYDQRLQKSDGHIDWTKPADIIEREIRAFQRWPKSKTILAGLDVIVTAAEIIDQDGVAGNVIAQNKELIVNCGSKSLRITQLKPAGKKEMTGEAFLAGHKHLFST